jgi:hypothetical protein
VGDVVRPRSVESRVHFDDELDPGVVGAPHVVWPMEPAVLTLDPAVQELLCVSTGGGRGGRRRFWCCSL